MKCQRCGKPLPEWYKWDMEYPIVSSFCCECYYVATGDVVEEPEKDPKYESKRLDQRIRKT